MYAMLMPAVVLMLITLLVWLYMFIRRLLATRKHQIDPQDLATPEQVANAFDAHTSAPGNCFKNMFEVPVIFYALLAFIVSSGTADQLFLNLAWAFVVLRALQAIVHCTYNRVMHRFLCYFASTSILFFMVIRFFLILM